MSRKKIIAANWKMYKTPEQSRQFMEEFVPLVAGHSRDEIVICPPFVDIATVAEKAEGTNIEVGAQNIYWEKEGAFTAEISGEMLVGARCKWVILGHSERRQYFGETDDTVNRRLKVALEAGLAPIVCVGEVKEEREAGVTGDVLRRQCSRAFSGISARKAAKMAVAYEPVWAIGTGLTATPEMANEAHQLIRQEAANVFGDEYAQQLRILYGGSVKPENAHQLLSQEEIDGALVGGASLKPEAVLKDREVVIVIPEFRPQGAAFANPAAGIPQLCSVPGPREGFPIAPSLLYSNCLCTRSLEAYESLCPAHQARRRSEGVRKWWNWQTHHLEGVAPRGMRVQVPPSAPYVLLRTPRRSGAFPTVPGRQSLEGRV